MTSDMPRTCRDRLPRTLGRVTVALVAFACMLAAFATAPGAQMAANADTKSFSKEQIEQLVAPIALHPDALLSQILMASTYPLEVVQASRWSAEHPGLSGNDLETALEKVSWDASVKSLVAFPQVLQMMNDDIGWMQQLGDAFLAQQEDVLNAVQALRQRAEAAGSLKTTKEQKVEKQSVASAGGETKTIYVVESTDPEVIYVPAYDPTVVYGAWLYPAYPPYYWYPPGYVASRALWFATGVAVGRALWGYCDWRNGNVNINVNHYNAFNRTNIKNKEWQHKVEHRGGVPYRDKKVAEKYGRDSRDVSAREEFRGRAEAGRRDLPAAGQLPAGGIQRPEGGIRPGAGRPSAGQLPAAGQRPGGGPGGGERPAAGQRPGSGGPAAGQLPATGQRPAVGGKLPSSGIPPATGHPSPRSPNVGARPAAPVAPAAAPRPAARPVSRPPQAFQGVGNGSRVRMDSARGSYSRSAPVSRPSFSGGGRGGGGGGRVGGGGGRRR